MAGPAVLGTYAVASKYAELLRLPGTALTWVFYPQLAMPAARGRGHAPGGWSGRRWSASWPRRAVRRCSPGP